MHRREENSTATITTLQSLSADPILPDLSLNIRPPAGPTETWRPPTPTPTPTPAPAQPLPKTTASPRAAATDLSLSSAADAENHHFRSWRRPNDLPSASSAREFGINHGFSMLGVSDSNNYNKEVLMSKPIKGIPVYNSSSSCSPSPSPSPSSSGSFYRPYNSSSSGTMINGITMEMTLNNRSHHQYLNHHYNHNIINSDMNMMMMRSSSSRFMPKLQSKRNMRAPRMRWTSSLHARFIHAVELLGGHESN